MDSGRAKTLTILSRLARPLMGLALLAALLLVVDTARVAKALASANWGLFAMAVMAAVLANSLSALRWQRISAALGMAVPFGALMRIYLQGIALNSLLPGGIVGGDVYRSVQLRMLCPQASLARTGFAVLAERASGLWGLGVVAVLAWVWWWQQQGIPAVPLGYAMGVLGLALGPWLAMALLAWRQDLARALPQKLAALAEALPKLLPTLPLSMLMQATTILAFGLCLRSVGAEVDAALLALLCAGIFLGAVVPASVGGFGAREASTLFFFALVGSPIAAELLLAGSILFGITATLQGLVGALWFALPARRPPH